MDARDLESPRGLFSWRYQQMSILGKIRGSYGIAVPSVVLLILLAVGLFLRIYRLEEQSAWIDDFQSVAYLDAPGLRVFLTLIRYFNPESVPLYYVLQFAWSRIFGLSLLSIRSLSVLMGIVSILLAYHVGRKTLSQSVGVLAAGLMACSPLHIWYSQATRPYPLLILLALVSLTALLHAENKTSRMWWGAHAVANLALLWTHLLTALFILAVGAYVLIIFKSRFRIVFLWGLWHLAAVGSVMLYMRSMPYVIDAAYSMYHSPGLQQVLTVIAAPDAPIALSEIVPSLQSWRFLPESAAAQLHRIRPYGDYGLIILGSLAILFLSVQCGAKRLFLKSLPINHVFLLHLCVMILPGVTLAALSWIWRPCFMPRYVIYSAPSLYVALGYTILHFPVRWAKGGIFIILSACYLLQVSLVVPAETRTNWHGAASQINASGAGADYICVGYMPPQTRVLRYHLAPGGSRPNAAFTAHDLMEQARAFFFNKTVETSAVFWAVIQRDYGAVSLKPLESMLAARKAVYERFDFEALEHLTVYRISSIDTGIAPVEEFPEGNAWSSMIADAGIVFEDPHAYARALLILRRITDVYLPPNKMAHAAVSILCAMYGDLVLAEGFAASAIRIEPTYALGHMALGGALWRQGKEKEAEHAFSLAFGRGDSYIDLYQPFINAMLRADTAAAFEELDKLDRIYADLSEYVRALLNIKGEN